MESESVLHRYATFIANRAGFVVAGTLLLTALLAAQIPRLRVHFDHASSLPSDHPFVQIDRRVREAEDARHRNFMIISAGVSFLGIYLAWLMHLKDRAAPGRFAARVPLLTRALEAKYWIDEIYQAGIVEPLRAAGRAFFAIDRLVIELVEGRAP